MFLLGSAIGPAAALNAPEPKERSVDVIFAGTADNGTDNAQAFADAKAAAGPNGRIRIASGTYRFKAIPGTTEPGAAATRLSGVILDPEYGVVFIGEVVPEPDLRTTRAMSVRYEGQYATGPIEFQVSPELPRTRRAKETFLSPGDIDRSVTQPISGAGLARECNVFPSDQWSSEMGTATDQGISWSLVADGVMHAGLRFVSPGDHLRATFSGGEYCRTVVVRTASEWVAFYTGATGVGRVVTKPPGLPLVARDGIVWEGWSDHAAWVSGNCEWGVAIIAPRRFAVTLNGCQVFMSDVLSADIAKAGFGAIVPNGSAPVSASINYWTNTRGGHVGKPFVKLLCIGDSQTDAAFYGSWPQWTWDALDGSMGVRCTGIVNNAEGGANSQTQWAKLQNTGTQGCTHALIDIGTNDIASGFPPDQTYQTVGAMLDYLAAHGCRARLMIPSVWYAQGLVGGYGNTNFDPSQGGQTRAALRRVAADKSVGVLDLNEVLGPIVASLRLTGAVDPTVRDNLHLTAYAHKIKGIAAARALLADICPE